MLHIFDLHLDLYWLIGDLDGQPLFPDGREPAEFWRKKLEQLDQQLKLMEAVWMALKDLTAEHLECLFVTRPFCNTIGIMPDAESEPYLLLFTTGQSKRPLAPVSVNNVIDVIDRHIESGLLQPEK